MAFPYVRYSSLEQKDGFSEAMQSDAWHAFYDRTLKDEFAKAPNVYLDAAVSAYRVPMAERPFGKQLLNDVQPGDMIVIYAFNRCFRNAIDGATTISELYKRGVRVKSVDGMEYDYNTIPGFILVTNFGMLAELESRFISQRTKDGLAAAARRGKGIQGMPYFCERVCVKSRRVPVIRPEFVPLIDWCAKSLRDGMDALALSKEAARRAAILEGRKPCIAETYGFGHDRLKKGLAKELRAWDIDTATRIRVGDEVRFVWMPVKKGVEVEA